MLFSFSVVAFARLDADARKFDLVSVSAVTSDLKEEPWCKSKMLRIGSPGDYPPLASFDESDQRWEGFDVDVITKIAEDLGLNIHFVKTTWKNLSSDLKAHKFDLAIGGVSYTDDRKRNFTMTKSLIEDGKVALVHCSLYPILRDIASNELLKVLNQPYDRHSPYVIPIDNFSNDRDGYFHRYLFNESCSIFPVNHNNIKELHKIRIVENPGGTNQRFAEEWFPKSEVIIVSNNREPFEMLKRRQAHAMITDKIEAIYQANKTSTLCAVNVSHPFVTTNKIYMARKSDEKLISFINNWFDSHMLELMELKRNWGLSE